MGALKSALVIKDLGCLVLGRNGSNLGKLTSKALTFDPIWDPMQVGVHCVCSFGITEMHITSPIQMYWNLEICFC